MYPWTHLYVNETILGSLSADQVLGSILPDLLASPQFSWQKAHGLKADCPLPCRLILADALHGSQLPGLDYYTDKNYQEGLGYAFLKARPLVAKLKKLGVPAADALWRGHNIVEMAIEVDVRKGPMQDKSYLKDLGQQAPLIEGVQKTLRACFSPCPDLQKGVAYFAQMDGQAGLLAHHFASRLSQAYNLQLDKDSILELMDFIWPSLDDYPLFLEKVSRKMNQDLERLKKQLSCP